MSDPANGETKEDGWSAVQSRQRKKNSGDGRNQSLRNPNGGRYQSQRNPGGGRYSQRSTGREAGRGRNQPYKNNGNWRRNTGNWEIQYQPHYSDALHLLQFYEQREEFQNFPNFVYPSYLHATTNYRKLTDQDKDFRLAQLSKTLPFTTTVVSLKSNINEVEKDSDSTVYIYANLDGFQEKSHVRSPHVTIWKSSHNVEFNLKEKYDECKEFVNNIINNEELTKNQFAINFYSVRACKKGQPDDFEIVQNDNNKVAFQIEKVSENDTEQQRKEHEERMETKFSDNYNQLIAAATATANNDAITSNSDVIDQSVFDFSKLSITSDQDEVKQSSSNNNNK